MSDPVPCSHCGLPAPPSEDDGPSFCCAGCRTVHGLLCDVGLGDYYALRRSLDAGPLGRPADEATDALQARYEHLDDPALQAAHATAPGEITLAFDGLHCAACVWVLERLPRLHPAVTSVRVDYGRGRIHLRWDPEAIALSTIAASLHRLGYPPRLHTARADAQQRTRDRGDLWRLTVTGALAGNVMLLAFALYGGATGSDAPLGQWLEWLSLLLAIPAVTWGAWPFFRGAWSGLRAGVLHMDLPISLGITAGFGASVVATITGTGEAYYDSITTLVFLLLAGRFIQHRGQQRVATRGELWQGLVPGRVARREGEDWVRVHASALRPGDRVRIDPGTRVVADGRVIEGRGHVDASMLTGESRPLPVGPGSSVLAGAQNGATAIEIEVQAVGASTRLGRVIDRVEGADAERAPVVRLADRLAGWFVASVLGLSLLGGLWWWHHAGPARAFEVVISLLVVTCPCALGLATPLALTVARGRAAAAGYVIGSTAALEALARARHLVLDKTGTVTEGRVRVVDAGSPADAEALRLAAVLERGSAHPLAQALVQHASTLGPDPRVALAVVEHPGRGIEGWVDGHEIRVGSPRFVGPLPSAPQARIDALRERGLTAVVVRVDDRPATVLGLGDRLRAEAPALVQRLRSEGYSLSLRSGDHPSLVRTTGAALGIDDTRGDLSPEDKAAEVRGRPDTVMIGDGINDALALRSATVGVAMGGGAEAALRVADVYMRTPGLGPLAGLLHGARQARAAVRRNLAFSLVYNLVFASLALAGLVTPLTAAVLMPLSSLTVIAASLMQRSFRANVRPPEDPATQTVRPSSPFALAEMQ